MFSLIQRWAAWKRRVTPKNSAISGEVWAWLLDEPSARACPRHRECPGSSWGRTSSPRQFFLLNLLVHALKQDFHQWCSLICVCIIYMNASSPSVGARRHFCASWQAEAVQPLRNSAAGTLPKVLRAAKLRAAKFRGASELMSCRGSPALSGERRKKRVDRVKMFLVCFYSSPLLLSVSSRQ